MNKWTAERVCFSKTSPINVQDFLGLDYLGNGVEQRFFKHENVNRKRFYNGDSDIGEGIVGYFEPKLCQQLQLDLNYVFPGDEEGWRWQTFFFDDIDGFHQKQLEDSMREGITVIRDPDGVRRGFMVGDVNTPGVYIVLAILNQGRSPVKR